MLTYPSATIHTDLLTNDATMVFDPRYSDHDNENDIENDLGNTSSSSSSSVQQGRLFIIQFPVGQVRDTIRPYVCHTHISDV